MQQLTRVIGGRSSTRPFLMLGAAVLLIIVGLLGMHTFSASPGGHGSAVPGQHQSMSATQAPAPSSAATPHAVAHTDSAAASTTKTSETATTLALGEADAGSGSHDGMMVTCVLALLAGLLLLAAPMLLRRFLPRARLRVAHAFLTVTSARPRPPSLIFLSISRT